MHTLLIHTYCNMYVLTSFLTHSLNTPYNNPHPLSGNRGHLDIPSQPILSTHTLSTPLLNPHPLSTHPPTLSQATEAIWTWASTSANPSPNLGAARSDRRTQTRRRSRKPRLQGTATKMNRTSPWTGDTIPPLRNTSIPPPSQKSF